MSIFEYNGSAIVAMAGKECFAIGSDLRFGVQFQTLATDYRKVYKIHDQLFLGLAGLGTDTQTLFQRFKFKYNLYKLREERAIKPSTFGRLVSATLYEKRFGPYFVMPVIAGLEDDGGVYLSGMDSLGAIETAKDFIVAGSAPDSLSGMCESMFRPDMFGASTSRGTTAAVQATRMPSVAVFNNEGPEDLFETLSQCLLSGVDRDALSGWGAIVHVVTKDEIITRTLKGRMD